jgi:hypothetical protein
MFTSDGIYGLKDTPRLKLSGWVLAVTAAVAIGIVALIVALSNQTSTTTRAPSSVNPATSFAPAQVTVPSGVRDPQNHALLKVQSPTQTPANNSTAPVRDPITHALYPR